ncbi:MAG TPA: hypothetical protein PKU80_01135 [Candidatus Limiplasma sp.]|nr:hypothetical protein [Candidatus Limiplasma sp.]HRX08171.1 hypothetical protein [Candidatus Limiplasma sp.]
MKTKIFQGFLVAEAAVCVLLYFVSIPATDLFAAAAAFPFEQIGAGLRALSLSGGWGNLLAIVLYLLISLLPLSLLLFVRKKRQLYIEDGLLVLLSAALFFVEYHMINPGFIRNSLGIAANGATGKAILGGSVYSLIIGYLILRVLRMFSTGTIQKLERYITLMLKALGALFVYMAFGASLNDLLSSIASVQAGNAGNEHLLGATYVFLGLQYLVNAFPYLLDILIIFAAIRLISALRQDRYAAAAVASAERMSRLCAIALAAVVTTNIVFNLLELLFARSLMVFNQSVQIPVLSILFVLAALLFTRFLMESK